MKINYRQLYYVILLAMIGVSTQSCVSNKAFQTARTTSEGEVSFGGGISFPNAEFFSDSQDSLGLDVTNIGGFGLEIFGRYGITEKLDVGVNVTLIGTSGLDLKYQFLGDHESEIAGSISVGASILRITVDGDSTGGGGVFDFSVPAYFSWHPAEKFAIYASPRYTFRRIGDTSANFIGGLGGLKLGGENAFFIEYGFFGTNSDSFGNQRQFNLGFATNLN